MTRIKLPFIQRFRDNRGMVRHYFRRPGFKRIPLPGLPGSEEFMDAYKAALAGERVSVGAARTKPGTVADLVARYFRSGQYLSLADSTRATYRGIIERFRIDHGDKRVVTLQREHIARMLDKKALTPAAANNWLRMVRMLMDFAVQEDIRRDNPTLGVKSIRNRSKGFHTWTEEEIATFEAKHPVGSRARLALALLLYTAQRRSDVVVMGRQNVRAGVLSIRQRKTGTEVDIPLHTDLIAIIDATPSGHMTFLTTAQGKPFTPAGFGNWFRSCCNEAGLARCSAHGLRKAAATRLADAGCSAHEIASITGHRTLKEVERYTREADRRRLASGAIGKIGTGTRTVKQD